MQLIINCPTDKKGIREFNTAFAQVQKELVLYGIRKLNLDIQSKEKVLNYLVIELKKQVDKKERFKEL